MLMVALAITTTSCFKDDDVSSDDAEWRDINVAWYEGQAALTEGGSKYYTAFTAPWDPAAEVLIHWFNDTTLTRNNLKPLYTSQVDVKYHLSLYDGTAVDSSYLSTTPADSIFRCRLNTGVIQGWAIAITKMHIGDSCRVIIPYNVGYGSTKAGDIKAYSTLQFHIKLKGIPAYEK
jgi:hypothetical protein